MLSISNITLLLQAVPFRAWVNLRLTNITIWMTNSKNKFRHKLILPYDIKVFLYRMFFGSVIENLKIFDVDSSVLCFETFIIDKCFTFDLSIVCISEGDRKCVTHLTTPNLSRFSTLHARRLSTWTFYTDLLFGGTFIYCKKISKKS